MSQLAQPVAMSLPAVMKHLDVLTDAGLVAREKTGAPWRAGSPPIRWRGHRLAQSLPALLVLKSRPSRRIGGGRSMATPSAAAGNAGLASRPSLTLNVVSMRLPKKSTPRGPNRKK